MILYTEKGSPEKYIIVNSIANSKKKTTTPRVNIRWE